jgi:hypothetical protein
MLVCLLGCDILFENGYIVVDSICMIRQGRRSHSAALAVAVQARAGRTCAAHNSHTTPDFAHHAPRSTESLAEKFSDAPE